MCLEGSVSQAAIFTHPLVGIQGTPHWSMIYVAVACSSIKPSCGSPTPQLVEVSWRMVIVGTSPRPGVRCEGPQKPSMALL